MFLHLFVYLWIKMKANHVPFMEAYAALIVTSAWGTRWQLYNGLISLATRPFFWTKLIELWTVWDWEDTLQMARLVLYRQPRSRALFYLDRWKNFCMWWEKTLRRILLTSCSGEKCKRSGSGEEKKAGRPKCFIELFFQQARWRIKKLENGCCAYWIHIFC